MKQTFGKIPRSLIALETGTHSPWISSIKGEVKKKHSSCGWSFSFFAAHWMEQDWF
jgi:hypothetical protein